MARYGDAVTGFSPAGPPLGAMWNGDGGANRLWSVGGFSGKRSLFFLYCPDHQFQPVEPEVDLSVCHHATGVAHHVCGDEADAGGIR